jgi:UDP-3-O-acyl-N-acetylglucosamine deacetylase
MNNALLRALLADREAWDLATFPQRREAPRMFARDWVAA